VNVKAGARWCYCVECGERFQAVNVEGDELTDEMLRFLIEDAACPKCWGALDVLPAGVEP
jgi:hypothetical protein